MVPKTLTLTQVCEFPECGRKISARRLCNGHHKQKMAGRTLRPLVGRSLPLDQRFFSKVEKTDTCWNWAGTMANRGRTGYGQFYCDGRTMLAHRVSYEMANGSIPRGLSLDHTCRNRACVNPEHLRTVTHKENMENQAGAHRGNKSGVRGVSWCAVSGKWIARVGHHGKDYRVGRFDSIAEAEGAVIAKRLELHTHNDLDRARV